jgi:dihydrofolate reductase
MIGIVAFCRNQGISVNGKTPWYIKEDLVFFRKMTLNSVVIMGRCTYESIGKPLSNRINIVITKSPEKYSSIQSKYNNIFFVTYDNVFDTLKKYDFTYPNVFVIGGAKIYELFFNNIKTIYVTYIDKQYECDTVFPKIPSTFVLTNFSQKYFSESEQSTFRFLKYELSELTTNCDETYLNLSKNILNSTAEATPDASGYLPERLFPRHMVRGLPDKEEKTGYSEMEI